MEAADAMRDTEITQQPVPADSLSNEQLSCATWETCVVTEPGEWLDVAYALLRGQFGKAEMDPKERYQDWLRLNAERRNPAPFVMLVLFTRLGDRAYVGGVLAGNVMPLLPPGTSGASIAVPQGARHIFAIGHQLTAQCIRDVPLKGLGRRLWEAAIGEARSVIARRKGVFAYSFLESQEDSAPYWIRLGYRWPQDMAYWQPPLQFGPDGLPRSDTPEVPELAMVLPIDGVPSNGIARDDLLAVVNTVYYFWSLRKYESTLTHERMDRARGYVLDVVFDAVRSALPPEDPVPLRVPASHDIRAACQSCAGGQHPAGYELGLAELSRSYHSIIAILEEQEFRRAAAAAKQFIDKYASDKRAAAYVEIAKAVKLFSEAYRTWQISYQYVEIRSKLFMARDLAGSIDVRNAACKVFTESFAHLCDAVSAYTRCENAFITNNPAELARNATLAIEAARQGMQRLDAVEICDLLVRRSARWVKDYLHTNLLLYEGLGACARVYEPILNEGACPDEVYHEQYALAREKLTELSPLSSELASELNAHVQHIRRHYHRTRGDYAQTTGRLLMKRGRVVITLSAAFDRGIWRQMENLHGARAPSARSPGFLESIQNAFRQVGICASNGRESQLHDIFETAFGKTFLRSISVDLPSIRIRFAEGLEFDLQSRVTCLGLGVCTVVFELPAEDREQGVTVEQARMLQSLICPHAGQCPISPAQPQAGQPGTAHAHFSSNIIPLRLLERIDQRRLHEILGRCRRVCERHSGEKPLEPIRRSVAETTQWLDALRERTVHADRCVAWTDPELGSDALHALLTGLLAALRTAATAYRHESERSSVAGELADELRRCATELLDCTNAFTYLADLGEYYLTLVGDALGQMIRSADAAGRRRRKASRAAPASPFWLRRDTGWYTYVYAREIQFSQRPATCFGVDFGGLRAHPDVLGFVVEQREARASFDDWRHVGATLDDFVNLALIRSHPSDAFYVSEHQSFFYLPDDPLFLTDQYEATVELISALEVALRHAEHAAQELATEVREYLGMAGGAEGGVERVNIRALNAKYDAMKELRADVSVLQRIVSRVGISRYKDHSDLMVEILRNMKLDKAMALLDRQVEYLGSLQEYLLELVGRKRDRLYRAGAVVLSSLLAVTGVEAIVSASMHMDWVRRAVSLIPLQPIEKAQSSVTLFLMLLAAVLLGYFGSRVGK
jgi:hypothetical protein